MDGRRGGISTKIDEGSDGEKQTAGNRDRSDQVKRRDQREGYIKRLDYDASPI